MDNEMEMDNIVSLTDENGNEVRFEFLDLVEYDGGEYVVLLSEGDDSGEVVILKLIETGDEETYAGVEDEEILHEVFQRFKEKYKDQFDFVDE
ncbi:DUF1292 domain-containing protein [Pseudoflavonifractor phocaeensis]|uniref:DUF1292 domain-containing protein n=1 Tax=Pseudoflavonifractor phocaeensis TaxID=1870988 RepID=UPI001FAF2D5C|nr:DUF1292 domain-containing protein [Pseudoflavonifractor phocaeensis]